MVGVCNRTSNAQSTLSKISLTLKEMTRAHAYGQSTPDCALILFLELLRVTTVWSSIITLVCGTFAYHETYLLG